MAALRTEARINQMKERKRKESQCRTQRFCLCRQKQNGIGSGVKNSLICEQLQQYGDIEIKQVTL